MSEERSWTIYEDPFGENRASQAEIEEPIEVMPVSDHLAAVKRLEEERDAALEWGAEWEADHLGEG